MADSKKSPKKAQTRPANTISCSVVLLDGENLEVQIEVSAYSGYVILANGLVGTGLAFRYRLQPRTGF